MVIARWGQGAVAGIVAILLAGGGARAQEGTASSPPSGEIVVEAQLEEVERKVETLTRRITRRPRTDKPISRRYSAICVGVHGMTESFAHVLIDRVEDNARELGIPVLGPGCQVNTLIAFASDSRAEIERLRKAEPWLFDTLLDYEYDRIMRGNGAVQAWQATEVKGADGKEFATMVVGNPPREVQMNKQPFASNISQQLRVDIEGSIVVFDNAHVPGKSLQQLADYATMRLFAPTDDVSEGDVSEGDVSEGGGAGVPTILSLFAEAGDAPDGLTSFDRAYLGALYKLPPTARGAAIHDATWSAYRSANYEVAETAD